MPESGFKPRSNQHHCTWGPLWQSEDGFQEDCSRGNKWLFLIPTFPVWKSLFAVWQDHNILVFFKKMLLFTPLRGAEMCVCTYLQRWAPGRMETRDQKASGQLCTKCVCVTAPPSPAGPRLLRPKSFLPYTILAFSQYSLQISPDFWCRRPASCSCSFPGLSLQWRQGAEKTQVFDSGRPQILSVPLTLWL